MWISSKTGKEATLDDVIIRVILQLCIIAPVILNIFKFNISSACTTFLLPFIIVVTKILMFCMYDNIDNLYKIQEKNRMISLMRTN